MNVGEPSRHSHHGGTTRIGLKSTTPHPKNVAPSCLPCSTAFERLHFGPWHHHWRTHTNASRSREIREYSDRRTRPWRSLYSQRRQRCARYVFPVAPIVKRDVLATRLIRNLLRASPAELHHRAVRIYQPTRNTMQSGSGKSGRWRIDWDILQGAGRWENPLMGYASS